ncbi:chromogranin-A isoform X2 [Salmo trutta]|uniref:Chromogranin-A n=1 Tax=Salmo trutta TaxID=8032 RepID=A0A674AYK4_SALTR|nr:chromogranin-A isoform X2 [Salmo trutta]
MIARGYLILTILVNRVLSLPVTPTYLEKEDVEVMKCIVEVLADVLSRPHRLAVSQECLNILRTDERLVSILRHRNFLKELQDIAVEGANERAQQHVDITADHVTKKPQGPQGIDEAADRSMLAALGGPGERSILSQKRRTGGEGEGEAEGEAENSAERDGESSRERNEIIRKGEEKKREKDETPDNRISDAMNKEGKEEGKDVDVIEKKEEEEEEEEGDEEKRASSREDGEEAKTEGGNVTLDKKGAESGEVTDAPEEKSEEKKSAEENEEEVEEKRSALPLQDSAEAKKEWEEEEEEDDEGEVKREVASVNHWSRMNELARSLQTKKRAGEEEKLQEVKKLEVGGQREVPHHSKEVVEEEVEERRKVGEARKSPEVKALQMMARRELQERRMGEEEEGSTSRKTEDPEIESLAAIESELESVAQKLHELRRG